MNVEPPLFNANCKNCGALFDSEVVYRAFVADFNDRTGLTFEGRTPSWVRNFCSEGCRYVDLRERARVANEKVRGSDPDRG